MTPELEQELVSLIGRPDPVILEIGCNDGTDTRAMLSLFPGARVYCFEPDARAQRRFRAEVNDPRVTLTEAAVGTVDGEIDFYPSDGFPIPDWQRVRPEGWDFSGSIRKPKLHLQQHPWCRFNSPVKIRSVRLDSWANETGVTAADFIWADVQGAEVDLISGGTETLRNTRLFYTEYNDQELYEGQINLRRLCELLPGFEIVHVYPDDVLLRNRGSH